MPLIFKYATSGSLKLSGSSDNLSNILHYYKFDDNNLDSFGFFDLIGTNQYQAGVVNKSVLTSKFAEVGGKGSIDGAFFSGNSFTLSFWFKVGSTSKDQNIFRLNSPDQDLIIKFATATKKIYFNTLSNIISNTIISGTIWYFLCIKKIGANVSIQLNNQTPVTFAYNYNPIRFNSVVPTDLNVISPTKYSALFLDDVRFYYSPLNSKEISYIYNNGKPQEIKGGDRATLWDSPDHYYTFNNFLVDEAGKANLSIVFYSVSGGTSSIVKGKINNALQIGNTYSLNSFLGYDYYGYTYYDDNILGTAGESFSLAFWVKRIATPLPEITNQISVLNILTSSNDIILKFGHDGKNLFLVDDGTVNGSSIELSSTITDWNHIGIAYNADQGRYTFFLNGKIYGEIAKTRNLYTAAKFYLGWDGVATDLGNPYLCQDALIDDLRIYNRAISSWDFYAIYTYDAFQDFEKSLSINFNLGTLPLKSYQIESYEFYEDDPNSEIVIPDAKHKLSTIIQQIWARDIGELCRILKSNNFYPNIKTVYEWSNNLIGPYGGGDPGRDNYGSYIKIEDFCDNADCVDFCLSVNSTVNVSAISFAVSANDVITASGGGNLTGSATVAVSNNVYISDGYFEISGSANASQIGGIDGTNYTASGGFEIVGSASVESSDLGSFLVEASASMNIDKLTPILINSAGSGLTGAALSSRDTICDCKNIPYQIQLRHNLNTSSELTRFVTRNNLTLPTIVPLIFNQKISQYCGNISLQGLSSFANANEVWTISFNIYCTGEWNQFANRYNWILNLNVKRSTVGFYDKETNVIIYLLSNYICPQFDASKFKFSVSVNLNTLVTKVNNSSFINSSNLNDRIGLFASSAWLNNPNLVLSVGA